MKTYKDEFFCVVDNGLFCELARTLAPHVGKSGYYSRWESGFPSQYQLKIGDGFKGVTRVNDFHTVIPEVGTWIFPDILFAGAQAHLEELGANVWGARYGEDLENWRKEAKEIFKSLGIPVAPYKVVIGVTELRKYLEKKEDVWVKVSLIRGMCETFHVKNLELTEAKLDRVARDLGPWKEKQEFIVEDSVPDAVEIAFDLYTIRGQFPKTAVFGVEIKSSAYFCMKMPYASLPAEILDFNQKMVGTLEEYNYIGNFPVEIRVKKAGGYVALDPCCREGSPSFEVKLNLISNWPEIYYQGARGTLVEPEFANGDTCGMQLILYSRAAEADAVPIHFPSKYRDNLKLRYAAEVDGIPWILPQPCTPGAISNSTLGSIVATGKTYDECKEKILEIKKEVEVEKMDCFPDALDDLKDCWEDLQNYGIKLPKL